MEFLIHNHSGNDLYILKWNTPLDESSNRVFKVISEKGYHLRHDGLRLRKDTPEEDDFLFLRNGESKSVKVDLTKIFHLHKPMRYFVEFNNNKLVYVLAEAGKSPSESYLQQKVYKTAISCNPETFNLHTSERNAIKTVGMQLREVISGSPTKRNFHYLRDLEPEGLPDFDFKSVIKANSVQMAILKRALKNSLTLLNRAIQLLDSENDASHDQYEKWFGRYAGSRYRRVLANFRRMGNTLIQNNVTYRTDGSQYCQNGRYAFTGHGASAVFFCDLFFRNSTPNLVRAGTVVHELSHLVLGTVDSFHYSREEAKNVAQNDPANAIQTASCYEYFALDS